MSKTTEQTKKPATEDKPKVNSTEELNVEELEERIAPTKTFPRK
jgi:uncharacterized small protein (DUF1192 family)